MSVVEDLGELSLFRSVPARALRQLCSLASMNEYASGQTVFEQGASADVALLLISGRLEAWVEVQRGMGRRVGEVREGEIVGESALFASDRPRAATVRAMVPSRCLEINTELLERGAYNAAMVAIEHHLLATLTRRIRSTNTAIQKEWRILSTPSESETPSFRQRLITLLGLQG